MDNQTILACDDNGKFLEYIPRMEGHLGHGKRHIGITIVLLNKKGQMLLQRRKHLVFDNIWCFTADTHPLHLGERDETNEEACVRCLDREYAIKKKINFNNYGKFNYFGIYKQYCENENCFLMVGEYNGKFILNPEAGYEYKWVSKEDFLKDFEENPKKYAPGVPEGVELLKKFDFFCDCC